VKCTTKPGKYSDNKGYNMFGLDNKGIDLSFELEKDLKGPNRAEKAAELKELLNSRIEELKGFLRKGENKDDFEKTEILLRGYMSMQKVVEKASKK
jgi:hypothetical protein